MLAAATAAHAETIYLKCWARGLTGDQRSSVYINGEQVTVNLDDGTMHSWTFGSNLAVHVTDTHLLFETALTLGNIWQNLFDPTAVGEVSSTRSTARLRRINATVLSSAGTAVVGLRVDDFAQIEGHALWVSSATALGGLGARRRELVSLRELLG